MYYINWVGIAAVEVPSSCDVVTPMAPGTKVVFLHMPQTHLECQIFVVTDPLFFAFNLVLGAHMHLFIPPTFTCWANQLPQGTGEFLRICTSFLGKLACHRHHFK